MTDPALLAQLCIRVVVAILLGGAIGLERQWRLRTAGIRTNALVSAGAALFVIVGAVGLPGSTADPTRVAAQVVSGIGFLGAGVILRDGLNIRGLTTAATLWCAAAIGSLAGAGMEIMALIGCIAIIATNTLLRPLSRMINRRTRPEIVDGAEEDSDLSRDFLLEVITTEKSEQRVKALVVQSVAHPQLTLRSLDVVAGKNAQVRVLVAVSAANTSDVSILERAVQSISLDPKVTGSRWWQEESED